MANEFTITLRWDQMRDNVKLFLAVPMYGGNCNGTFSANVSDFLVAAASHGITVRTHYLYNESLITRARNYSAEAFLQSDCTHMLFIDADINFNPADIFCMIQMAINETEKFDVLCAPYPKKTIAWEKIVAAVNAGVTDNKDANILENFVGDFVINFLPGQVINDWNVPLEVLESGTGFMLIQRQTFAKWKAAFPEFEYYPDHLRQKGFDGSKPIHGYFLDPLEDRGDGKLRHLSEDYFFCQRTRKAGMKVWICPWMRLKHVGTYTFGGSMADMAGLGLSATADEKSIVKR